MVTISLSSWIDFECRQRKPVLYKKTVFEKNRCGLLFFNLTTVETNHIKNNAKVQKSFWKTNIFFTILQDFSILGGHPHQLVLEPQQVIIGEKPHIYSRHNTVSRYVIVVEQLDDEILPVGLHNCGDQAFNGLI